MFQVPFTSQMHKLQLQSSQAAAQESILHGISWAKLQICKSSNWNKATLPFPLPAAGALGRACVWLVSPRLPERGSLHPHKGGCAHICKREETVKLQNMENRLYKNKVYHLKCLQLESLHSSQLFFGVIVIKHLLVIKYAISLEGKRKLTQTDAKNYLLIQSLLKIGTKTPKNKFQQKMFWYSSTGWTEAHMVPAAISSK